MSNNVYQVFIADEHIRSVEMKVTHIHNNCNSAKNNINAQANLLAQYMPFVTLPEHGGVKYSP